MGITDEDIIRARNGPGLSTEKVQSWQAEIAALDRWMTKRKKLSGRKMIRWTMLTQGLTEEEAKLLLARKMQAGELHAYDRRTGKLLAPAPGEFDPPKAPPVFHQPTRAQLSRDEVAEVLAREQPVQLMIPEVMNCFGLSAEEMTAEIQSGRLKVYGRPSPNGDWSEVSLRSTELAEWASATGRHPIKPV